MPEKAIDRIFKYLESQGIPHTRFEKDIGISNGYLNTQRNRNADLGEGIINKVIDNSLINPIWLITGRGEMLTNNLQLAEPAATYTRKGDRRIELQSVPLYNTNAAAGLTKTFSDSPNVMDYISIPNLPKCDGAIYITGDSMYPLLKSGDIVAYKRIKDITNGILWGEMYLVSFMIDDEDYTLVKYIQKSELGNDFVKLVSQNQHHQPKDIPFKNITALALVKASIRFNSMN
jgi:phage repressor protein C with HTH and peptisase S24 domain